MLVIKVKDLIEVFEGDIEIVLANKKDSNRTKTAHRDRMAIQFLKTLPLNFELVGERVPNDFLRMNFGTMTENIIRAHYELEKNPKLKRMTKSSDDFDITIGGKSYEIKTCINGSYYNTKVTNDKGIILVASDGVYYLPKDKKQEYINEKGKLPYKEVNARHYTKIERLLGYEVNE